MTSTSENGTASANESIVVEVINHQLEHFRQIDPPCRGMELPDGVLLRHTRSQSLFFYLKTGIEDGKIVTQIYASDSPYDRQKAGIGTITTAMFEAQSDRVHLGKLERLIRNWVEFVDAEPDSGRDFHTFKVDPRG